MTIDHCCKILKLWRSGDNMNKYDQKDEYHEHYGWYTESQTRKHKGKRLIDSEGSNSFTQMKIGESENTFRAMKHLSKMNYSWGLGLGGVPLRKGFSVPKMVLACNFDQHWRPPYDEHETWMNECTVWSIVYGFWHMSGICMCSIYKTNESVLSIDHSSNLITKTINATDALYRCPDVEILIDDIRHTLTHTWNTWTLNTEHEHKT